MSPLRYLRDTAVFAPCYLALDWASYIDPVGPFNITPWNPQPALAIVWMLLGGMHYVPAVLATIFAADLLVRHAPGGYFITALTAVTLAGGYAAIAWILRALLSDLGLRSSRQLTVFVAVVLGGTAIVGTAKPGRFSENAAALAAGPLPKESFDKIRARWREVAQADWSGQT